MTFKVKVDEDVDSDEIANTAHVNDGLIDQDTNTTKNVAKKPPVPSVLPVTNDTFDGGIVAGILASVSGLVSVVLYRRNRQLGC